MEDAGPAKGRGTSKDKDGANSRWASFEKCYMDFLNANFPGVFTSFRRFLPRAQCVLQAFGSRRNVTLQPQIMVCVHTVNHMLDVCVIDCCEAVSICESCEAADD